MGIFDYECKPCRKTVEVAHGMTETREGRRCPRCNTVMRPMISVQAHIAPFVAYDEWNLEHNAPVHITSASHLDRECDKRGLRAGKGGTADRLAKRRFEAYHAEVARTVEQRKKHG